jgi:hypothetical protein
MGRGSAGAEKERNLSRSIVPQQEKRGSSANCRSSMRSDQRLAVDDLWNEVNQGGEKVLPDRAFLGGSFEELPRWGRIWERWKYPWGQVFQDSGALSSRSFSNSTTNFGQ